MDLQLPGTSSSSAGSSINNAHPNENAFADVAISLNLINNATLSANPGPSASVARATQARQVFNTMVEDIVDPYGNMEVAPEDQDDVLGYGDEESTDQIVTSAIHGIRMLMNELRITTEYLGKSFSPNDEVKPEVLDLVEQMRDAQVNLRNSLVTLRDTMPPAQPDPLFSEPAGALGWGNDSDSDLEPW